MKHLPIQSGITLLVVILLVACSPQNVGQAAPQIGTSSTSANVPVTGGSVPTSLPITQTPVQTGTSPTETAISSGCQSPASLTPSVTEGPFFKANSPERSSLLDANVTGTTLALSGYVFTNTCEPVAHAMLDFWQANDRGEYDNSGYTLRGHQFTGEDGSYHLDTIIPGLYTGRTEHIHVKVQAPGGQILTTQLFFPGVANNQSDSIFNPDLLINLQKNKSGAAQATFNFIINPK